MKIFYLAFLLFSFISCAQESTSFKTEYPPRHIGDIEFDEKLDDPDFKLCNEQKAYQYFNIGQGLLFKGEQIALEKEFLEKYNSDIAKKESGFLRIRFIVNCKGETGRFRILGADENYKENEFDKSITSQLLQITKELKNWQWLFDQEKQEGWDYYQYLIFKIENGQIVKILP